MSNDRIVAIARGWIGTPYHHQASLKGVGCDCLGLVRGIWRDYYGTEPELPPPYSPDWGQVSGKETLLEAGDRHFKRIDPDRAGPGDLLVFRMRPKAIAKHCAVLSFDGRMIHALEGTGVCEVTYDPAWKRRTVGGFAFV